MKFLYKILLFILLNFPIFNFAQEVTTLAEVTANGGISVDTAGNLFVAHFGPLPPNFNIGKNIYKITPTGDVSLFVDGQLNVGSGNSIDENGFLYQSNFATGAIYKIDELGNIVNTNYATIGGPVGITTKDSTLYICSCNSNSIKEVSPTGVVTDFATSNLFNCANGITEGPNENFYTTNFSNGDILKITPVGEVELLGSTPVGNGHIAFCPNDQNLYIASYSGNQIFKMDLNGNVELFAGTGAAGKLDSADPMQATFNKPNGIEISPDGCSLYISQDQDVLREIKLEGNGCVTAVENLDYHPKIKIFPNPASKHFRIENPKNIELISISVLDVNGELVQNILPKNQTEFEIIDLPTGIYVVMLIDKMGNKYSKKLMVL